MKNPLLIGSVAVVVGGLLVAPRFVGNHVESRMNELIASVDANPMIEVRWSEYHHGWFSSGGVLDVRLTVPVTEVEPPPVAAAGTAAPIVKTEMTTVDFQYRLDLAHGPVILDSGVTLALASWTGEIMHNDALDATLSWDRSSPLYWQSGRITLGGNLQVQETVSPFSLSGDQVSATFSGYQGSGKETNGTLAYSGEAASLVVNGPEDSVKFEGFRFEMEMDADLAKVMQGSLYNMDGLLSVDQVLSGEGSGIRNLQVEINAKLNEDESLADIHAGYRVQEVFGGEISLSDLGFDVVLTNYSAAFNRRYNELVQQTLFQNNLSPETIQAVWKESLPLLLQSNPTMRLENLRFTLPEGSFNSEVSLSLNGMDLQGQSLDSPEFWLQNLVLNASASADKPLAERLARQFVRNQAANNPDLQLSEAELERASAQQASMMLAMLGAQGMLREEGEQFRLDFRMTNGQANLNGQPIPLPEGLGQP